ncbi:MAG: DUF192 domain-containing protein [Candidatus Levybacteria bacterium]|nr:DUF192 domain-containing protein [Candidatus Levybacteria bacterium]
MITIIMQRTKSPKAVLGDQEVKLEIAKSLEQKQTGLSRREKLEKESGMLFTFDEKGYYPFWMKDMRFSLDIIFLNDKKIVTIYKNVNPPKGEENPSTLYVPDEPANRVLEINAGLSDEFGIKDGDTIEIENL